MTWVKIDDGAHAHPKLLAAGPEAVCLWLAGLCYANTHATDGTIPTAALAALYPTDEWSKADRRRLSAKLVEVGLWVAVDGVGWVIHDYSEHQSEALREVRDERRAFERERKARQRQAKRAYQESINSDVLRALSQRDKGGTEGGAVPRVSQAPVPSRPVPEIDSNESIVLSALAGSTDHGSKGTIGETTEGQRQTDKVAPGEALRAQPAGVVAPKPSAGAVEPPALSLTSEEAPRGKRRAAKPEAPPPFGIGEAFEALASSALGRFSAGIPRDWTKGHRIAVARAIRAYPTLDEWSILGAWLAAGGDRYRGTLSVAWAASNALSDAMARARDWSAQGRPALDGHRQQNAPQVPATVPLASSQYSAPKPLPEGVKSPSQIIRERQAAAARRMEAERGTH